MRSFLLTLCVVVFCYFYVDKNLVYFIHNNKIDTIIVLYYLANFPAILVVMLKIYVIVFLFTFKKFKENKLFQMLFLATIAATLTSQIKQTIKFIFGRYWPNTWLNNNLSLLQNDMYGFQFFHKGNTSFPSGHMAVTFTVCTIAILYYPKHKKYFLIPMIFVPIGQIGMNFHFLSDVIAGGYLGYGVAILMTSFIKESICKKFFIS